MKFLSKYQLRERITSRPVEVFLAQELRTGLSRLVHVVEWKDDFGEVTSQEILKLICRWAPEPPGVILEAGKDETTSNAYLVTTLPADPLAVQAWVQSYEGAARGMRANRVAKVEEEEAKPDLPDLQPTASPSPDAVTAALDISILGPTASAAPPLSADPGDFTKAFGEIAAPQPKVSPGQFPAVKVVSPTRDKPVSGDSEILRELGRGAEPLPAEGWTRRETGAFTKEFLGVLGEGPVEREATLPKPSEGKVGTRPQGTFTREFFGLAQKPPSAPSPARSEKPLPVPSSPKPEHPNLFSDIDIPPAKPEYSPLGRSEYREPDVETKAGSKFESKLKTGEFTEFFRGVGGRQAGYQNERLPLVGESRPAEIDNSSHGDDGTPKKGVFPEDFFANPSKPASSTFTGDLKTSEPLAAPDFAAPNFTAPGLDRSAKPSGQRFDSPGEFGGVGKGRNYAPPGPGTFGLNRSPDFQPGATMSVPEPDWDGTARPTDATKDATHLFTPPGAGPMPSSLPVEEGPSEFTIVVQRGNQPPPSPAVAGQGPASGPSQFKLPAMQVPPMPPPPMIPHSPSMPHAPMIPHVQMLQIPSAAPLATPKIPAAKLPTASVKSPVSHLPLIIALNVVLVLAIALILYFALKPH